MLVILTTYLCSVGVENVADVTFKKINYIESVPCIAIVLKGQFIIDATNDQLKNLSDRDNLSMSFKQILFNCLQVCPMIYYKKSRVKNIDIIGLTVERKKICICRFMWKQY